MADLSKGSVSPVDEGMLDHVVTLPLLVQGARCGITWCHSVWVGHDLSSTQATGVHSINNCVILGEHCGEFAVVARAAGVLVGPASQ